MPADFESVLKKIVKIQNTVKIWSHTFLQHTLKKNKGLLAQALLSDNKIF